MKVLYKNAIVMALMVAAMAPFATSAEAAHWPPWTVSHCAPAFYPWSHYQACETVSGQYTTIRWVSGSWRAILPPGPLGAWSFTGYGEIINGSHGFTYGPLRYHGFTRSLVSWHSPKVYVNWTARVGSYVCSQLMGGWPPFSSGVQDKATVCVKITLPRTR
jgi:hypothetical protein